VPAKIGVWFPCATKNGQCVCFTTCLLQKEKPGNEFENVAFWVGL